MSRLGFKSMIYHGDVFLGELDAIPVKDQNFQFPNNEIRVHHISPQSERCPPLSILQTVSSFSVRCKLESSSPVEQPHLINLHASCFFERKTAVVMNGDEEIHMVAMPSKEKKFPCFWCFAVPLNLYNSSVALLNMRCLSIVFDLDETLIVANTMKSFEDRIDWLRNFMARENDPLRFSGMSAEMKRLMEDRLLLKQYIENDYVMDNGKMLKVQLEEVPALADTQEKIVRPVIRLQERNLVLTRINPEIRDTSVLVKFRPAWEDLRSYLTAKGRKRFEVYVCTMAERDYALEMWRLLDPGSHLISSKELSGRVVCVKSGAKKSLLNVFQDGICHPKMAMVIDDRAMVWEDKDQPRVHVVPAFSPYYAPQAETAHAVPVLCVARNVACNVRAYFFKEFDENLLRRLNDIYYEDDVINLPSAPDVSNYMMSEEAGFVPNCNGNAPFSDGMNGLEVERRLKQLDEKNVPESTMHSMTNSPDSRSEISQPHVGVVPNVVGPTYMAPLLSSQKPQPSLLGPPIRRDLRNPASGQPPILPRIPVPASISPPSMQPQGGWLVEDDVNQVSQHTRPSQESDLLKPDRSRAGASSYGYNKSSPASTSSTSHALPAKGVEVLASSDSQKQVPLGNQPAEVGFSQNPVTNSREMQTEAGKSNVMPSHFTIGVLQEIGKKCSSRVEFRTVVSTSKDLQFSVEVLFSGEKIGVGMGKSKKDAQQQAAENALHSLAEKYVSHMGPAAQPVDRDYDKLSIGNENGILWEVVSPEFSEGGRDDGLPKEQTPEAAEAEPVSVTSSLANQQFQKRTNIHRSYNPSKQQKEEQNGPQSLPASWQQKNGNHVL